MCIQTGHTLRLLSFPDFLDSFLQKVITIKKKLDGAINAAKTLFGIANFASGEAGKVLQRDRDTTEIETNIRKTRAGGLVLAVLCARTRTILSATDRKRVYACRTTSKTQLRRWRGRAQRQSSSSSSSATLNAPSCCTFCLAFAGADRGNRGSSSWSFPLQPRSPPPSPSALSR
eukprot:3338654-Rhodomonas_salina.2